MDRLASNTSLTPVPGDLWRFTPDPFITGKQLPDDYYRIVSVDECGIASMRQESGREPGFTCSYATDQMYGNRWTLIEGSEREVTFNCPRCDRPNPIKIGDYICILCRGDEALDLSD